MKKLLLSSAIAMALAVPAQAAVLVGNYGASTTLGQVATPTTINSVRFNPAAGYLALDHKNGENLRFGYLSQLGASVEFGEADNFETDIDALIDSLDAFNAKFETTEAVLANPSSYDSSNPGFIALVGGVPNEAATVTNAVDGANDVVDSANTVLNRMGDNSRLKTSVSVSVPGMPVVFELPKVPGVLSLDASVGLVTLAGFESDPFTEITSATDLDNLDSQFNTDSQVVVKGGTLFQVGLGYSQPINAVRNIVPLQGELIVGAKANLYMASLASVKAKIDRKDDDKDVSDLISDGLDESEDSTAIGLDVGAVWSADKYQLGLTVKNLIAPEFDVYQKDEVEDGVNAAGKTVKLELDPQTTLDGAVFMKDRALMLAGSADLNKVEDLVGDEVQMMHLSASYFPSNFAIPTVRVGYEKNLAGEELSALNFGLGLFRGVANLDVTYGLETTEVDGSDLPRRLGVQLSFEETF